MLATCAAQLHMPPMLATCAAQLHMDRTIVHHLLATELQNLEAELARCTGMGQTAVECHAIEAAIQILQCEAAASESKVTDLLQTAQLQVATILQSSESVQRARDEQIAALERELEDFNVRGPKSPTRASQPASNMHTTRPGCARASSVAFGTSPAMDRARRIPPRLCYRVPPKKEQRATPPRPARLGPPSQGGGESLCYCAERTQNGTSLVGWRRPQSHDEQPSKSRDEPCARRRAAPPHRRETGATRRTERSRFTLVPCSASRSAGPDSCSPPPAQH